MVQAWPMVSVAKLLAAAKVWEDPRVLVWTGVLTGGLLLGALVIAWVDRWRKRAAADDGVAADQLVTFRSLYERGELSREEYDRIRARLSSQLRQQWHLPPPRAAASPPPAPPAQPEPPAE
jgi:hypothetical protein